MQDSHGTPATFDENLVAKLKNGAGWLYWIAALSFVNSLLFIFGSNLGFPIGLSYTQIVDGVAHLAVEQGAPAFVKGIGLVFNAGIALCCASFGFFAARGNGWIFVTAILLYALDSLLFIAIGAFVSLGFHVFALIFMIRGYLAYRQLLKQKPEAASMLPSIHYPSP